MKFAPHFYTTCDSPKVIKFMAETLQGFYKDPVIINQAKDLSSRIPNDIELIYSFESDFQISGFQAKESFKSKCSMVPTNDSKDTPFSSHMSLQEIASEILKKDKTPSKSNQKASSILSQFTQHASLIDWNKTPKNFEHIAWNPKAYLQLEEKFVLKGKVVSGFRRNLGFVTANLRYGEISKELAGKLHGVYFGLARIGDSKERYPMTSSIGHNLHFNQENPTVEVYIFHKFDENFYEQVLEVEFFSLLRTQSSYKSINHLKHVIHNDIFFCESYLIPALSK